MLFKIRQDQVYIIKVLAWPQNGHLRLGSSGKSMNFQILWNFEILFLAKKEKLTIAQLWSIKLVDDRAIIDGEPVSRPEKTIWFKIVQVAKYTESKVLI